MLEYFSHPGFGALLFVLLVLWPTVRILRRAGRPPVYAALLLLNFVLPMLGLIAVCILLCRKPKTVAGAA